VSADAGKANASGNSIAIKRKTMRINFSPFGLAG
jgi:hypothetical protein